MGRQREARVDRTVSREYGGNSAFQDKVTVNMILELFGGLHGGAGPTLPHEPFGPADKLGGGGYGTSRAGTGAAPQSDESRGMGASHGEDGVGEVPVIGKGRAT